jgi:aerobic carbon-monoxide dehydrogenase medium subunit
VLRPQMIEPRTVAEAVAALRRRGAMPLAGATDLIPALRRGRAKPTALVNLKRLPGLAGVRRGREGVWIGALTTVASILRSPLLADTFPVLVETARDFGSPQVRTMATVGGNLCSGVPSADLAPPLLALDARAEIAGPKGERDLPLDEFFRGTGKTALTRGEIVTALLLPRPPVRSGAACVRLTGRQSMDLPLVAVAASVTLRPDGATCRTARLALGAVGPTPMRAYEAEALLTGRPLTPELIAEAAACAAGESRPIDDHRASAEYRRDMVAVLARRALDEAFARAGGGR